MILKNRALAMILGPQGPQGKRSRWQS